LKEKIMNVNTQLAILDRVRKYLTEDVKLDARLNGLDVVYRLSVEADVVRVDGYLPTLDGDVIHARTEQYNGVLWVAAMSVAWDDYVLADGPHANLVKLSNPLRDSCYESFSVKLDSPIYSREVYGQLIEGCLVEEEIV
jgi:hypothetical protein